MIASERAVGPLDGVLAGAQGAAGVRRTVTDPLRYGVLELLPAGDAAQPAPRLELLRSKYKPGRKLSAEYVLSYSGGSPVSRHATVAWTVTAEGVRSALWVSPADERMPQLRRLTDPAHVASLAASLIRRPVRAPRGERMGTIRYRPGQRHVLVTELGGELGRVYVKTDRECSGAEAVRLAAVVQEALARRCPEARAGEPLGWAPEDSAALWWAAPGLPLSRLLVERPGEQAAAVANVGRALRALHGVDGAEATHRDARMRLRDASAEAEAALGAGAHIDTLLPDVGAAYTRLLAHVVERLDGMPPEQRSLSHGDFKCDNLLIHRGAARILDLDRLCLAEPALDLGKFVADLVWWVPDSARRRPLEEAFRAGYGGCDPSRWERAELWAVLFRLKNAARRGAVHAPGWESLVAGRVASAGRAVRAAGRS